VQASFTTASLSVTCMAAKGQTGTHFPQPMHFLETSIISVGLLDYGKITQPGTAGGPALFIPL
jgi:hypothetical protein